MRPLVGAVRPLQPRARPQRGGSQAGVSGNRVTFPMIHFALQISIDHPGYGSVPKWGRDLFVRAGGVGGRCVYGFAAAGGVAHPFQNRASHGRPPPAMLVPQARRHGRALPRTFKTATVARRAAAAAAGIGAHMCAGRWSEPPRLA